MKNLHIVRNPYTKYYKFVYIYDSYTFFDYFNTVAYKTKKKSSSEIFCYSRIVRVI